MRRTKAFSLLLVIILLSGGLRDTSTAVGATPSEPPTRLVPADLIPPAMTSLAVEGNYAYVGTGPYLLVVDVSDPDKPKQVGYAQLPTLAKAVAVTGRRVYVLTDRRPFSDYYQGETTDDQVTIFDITNPQTPVARGQIGPGNYFSLTASGSILYLSGSEALNILEVSNPRHPITLASIPTPAQTYYSAAYISGSWLVLAYPSDFQVIDVSDPTHPGEISDSAGGLPGVGVITSISVEGDLAAVAGYYPDVYPTSKCVLIDLSDSTHPVKLSSISTGSNSFPSVALQGRRLYFTPQEHLLAGYDISDLNAPILIDLGEDPVWGLTAAGGKVYVAAGAGGFAIYNDQDPGGLQKLGSILGIGTAEDVAVQADSIYIADGGVSGQSKFADYSNGGLAIAAMHSLDQAEIIGRYSAGHMVYLDVEGDRAYVSGGSCGLRYYYCYLALDIIDVTQPETPFLMGKFPTSYLDDQMMYAGPVIVQNQTAYLPNPGPPSGYGLGIIDVSQPYSPTMLSIYKPPHEQSISVMGADITGRYGLVSSWNRDGPFNQSLQVIDVSDSLSPTLLADYPMNPTQVVVQGSFAFVAEIISGSDSMKLDVIDISQLPQIQVLSEINLPGNIHDVAFDGRYAYVADGQAGLRVVDLSDPSNPLEVFAYDTPGNAVAVAQEGEWVYLADQDGGLLVFRKVRNFVYMPVVNVTGAQ